MLFKNSVFVAAMLLSPSTVVGRTLKANKGDKGADKRVKRLEEKIDALTTLVEQIVANNDRDDSALGELCGQAIADKFACEFEPSEIEPLDDDPVGKLVACTALCEVTLSSCQDLCATGIFFPPVFLACEAACAAAEVVCIAICDTGS